VILPRFAASVNFCQPQPIVWNWPPPGMVSQPLPLYRNRLSSPPVVML
jgi:hypothetical protein